ncbi:30S ribosomal protein S6e [Candidatus Bathyarchaeota archaeon]|nr:30S ribosomal protein S6e [Candidatus Bathyarchaeota archaeon]
MAKFKIVVSDPKIGKAKSVEVEGDKAAPLIGRKIGDLVDGAIVGMPGVKLLITGGSDKDGFPMRPDIHGGVKTRVLLSGGVGFKPKNKGERRRKTVRGNTITEDIMQINVKIVEEAEKPATA